MMTISGYKCCYSGNRSQVVSKIPPEQKIWIFKNKYYQTNYFTLKKFSERNKEGEALILFTLNQVQRKIKTRLPSTLTEKEE